MRDIDLITALGQLLTNPSLRRLFRHDPVLTANHVKLRHEDLVLFVALDPDGMEAQAETLMKKRLRAVRSILPELFENNDEVIAQHFFAYAETVWPNGHTRHQQDAIHFAHYLLTKETILSKAEQNRIRFLVHRKRLGVHFVKRMMIRGRSRSVIQIFYRSCNKTNELRMYLAL